MNTTLIINIDKETKKKFKDTCKDMGVDMTTVLLSGIIKFIEHSKSTKK
jgi:antitoxin component of RelBE/YafQ-DinJ toxin-antitoxin module